MYKYTKRLLDIVISLVGIVLTLPILIITSILIKFDSKGPIIFKQERLGYKGKVFKIYKFRSMSIGAEKGGVYEAKNDPRVTKIGRVIRKTSIDELPQFFNILKGEMSLIGPRPALTYHPWPFNEYTEHQKQMFDVKPGVTGWAQVNGRKDVEWNKRIELNIDYVQNMSLLLDIKILFLTVFKVIKSENNYNSEITLWMINNMSFKLMYITNDEKLAQIADRNGVDWIFVDLEVNGKDDRQGHLDTVISRHSIEDVNKIKSVLNDSELLVRVNPIYEKSKDEVNQVIEDGADIVMLPYFKTINEVEKFVQFVDRKAKTCLLLETKEAVDNLDDILNIDGIDYIHIGLNDLHLSYELDFMFELLSNGMVENIIEKIKEKDIEYGFGGIAALGEGDLSSELILNEHIRLGSNMAILSRTFYRNDITDIDPNEVFSNGIRDIREHINKTRSYDVSFFEENKIKTSKIIDNILSIKGER